MRRHLTPSLAALVLALTLSPAAWAADAEAINSADPTKGEGRAEAIRLQVLLDRAGASPGVIDGVMGDATRKAIEAFEEMEGLEVDGRLDEEVWSRLSRDGEPVVETYAVSEKDAGQTLMGEEPADFPAMAERDALPYARVSEALAERFHMDEDLLKALNEGAAFDKAGTELLVTRPGGERKGRVARILVERERGMLRAYDKDGKLVMAAPAAVGSEATPTPEGNFKVTAVAADPTYTYDPANFGKPAEGTEPLTIPAGPNGPVGSMWIDLDKPTYGIHGTPEPATIFNARSHGCVRLTNWDATALAHMVSSGETEVELR